MALKGRSSGPNGAYSAPARAARQNITLKPFRIRRRDCLQRAVSLSPMDAMPLPDVLGKRGLETLKSKTNRQDNRAKSTLKELLAYRDDLDKAIEMFALYATSHGRNRRLISMYCGGQRLSVRSEVQAQTQPRLRK